MWYCLGGGVFHFIASDLMSEKVLCHLKSFVVIAESKNNLYVSVIKNT